ncbi:unnamed protein product [Ranitomeya imitator]|uniref:ribonuclease H n=1 Tax=Ranitomeya imitator TaxID=111125 RepID=A0ABN9M2I4_9NEOB|nr:unnamed protein product [Ranitomeya imitator]
MQKGEFLASIDIQDAYLHIPIFPPHQRFLRFAIHDEHFQFTALPFGLATAPRVFTKVMMAIISILLYRCMVVLPYLDDLLIKGPSFQACADCVASRRPTTAAVYLVSTTLKLAGIDSNSKWGKCLYGALYGAITPVAIQEFFSRPKPDYILKPEDCLSKPCTLLDVNMKTLRVEDLESMSGDFHFHVDRDGIFHGFTAWFSVQFQNIDNQEQVELDTGPFNQLTHWKHTLFMLDEPLHVYSGDRIAGSAVFKRNPIWRRHLSVTITWTVTSSSQTVQGGCKVFPIWSRTRPQLKSLPTAGAPPSSLQGRQFLHGPDLPTPAAGDHMECRLHVSSPGARPNAVQLALSTWGLNFVDVQRPLSMPSERPPLSHHCESGWHKEAAPAWAYSWKSRDPAHAVHVAPPPELALLALCEILSKGA